MQPQYFYAKEPTQTSYLFFNFEMKEQFKYFGQLSPISQYLVLFIHIIKEST